MRHLNKGKSSEDRGVQCSNLSTIVLGLENYDCVDNFIANMLWHSEDKPCELLSIS